MSLLSDEGLVEMKVTAAYDPADVKFLTEEAHTIEVLHVEPFFTFSPRGTVVIVKRRVKFKGWLSRFEPGESEDGEPVSVVTITPLHSSQE